MQQFFIEKEIQVGQIYQLTNEQKKHARSVRLMDERIRLVYQGKAFFATCFYQNNEYYARVENEDNFYNELPIHYTLALALIRKEKFELAIQKATELGASEIVPFISKRCVVKDKKNKKERYEKIVLEASQQCKRNEIPIINETIDLKDLVSYKQDLNYVAYEKSNANNISEVLKPKKDILIVIGPEGGFSEDEIEFLHSLEIEEVSLGSRILRAETAAIYVSSIISEYMENK